MAATKLKLVDVVVVGAGVAGTIVCKELAETGLKVVGLERGRMIDPQHDFAMPYVHDELKYERHSDLTQNLSRETITFRNAMNETALPMREMGSFKPGECVGGAGVHWGGTSFRFLPWDFETRSRTIERYGKNRIPEDCTSQDWGITYGELEPYYDQFEHLYGVGGKAGNLNGEIQPGGNPFEGPRSREYPNPPAEPTFVGSLFAKAAESLGYKPFPGPTAAMTRPYINPYRLVLGQCAQGGFCTSHGCAMGAKASPLTTVLPALLKHENFELRPFSNVIKVNLDSERKRAKSITYVDARGREVEQPAELVILTSYTFNNVRLMLLSGIGKPYDPVSNRGVVGRNYSYQTGGNVKLFFEDKVFNRFMGHGGIGTVIDEFNGDNFDHAGLGFMGGAHVGVAVNSGPGKPLCSHPVPPGTPRWGSGWKKAVAQYYDRTLEIRVSGGCQSYRTNYLDLDPTYRDAHGLPLIRMTFDWHENEKKISAYVTNKAGEIGQGMGASKMSVSGVTGKYSIVPYQRTHNIGGAVMGADPATSAANKYLQSWDVPNVFVIGGSAFPQNGAHGPTPTLGALACWAADSIKDHYLRRPGPLV
ncbi:MAG: GMC family oxidoreductase [Betaproteobacteria bacterium RIFCSPLOWO2_12_FULL_62_13]|nr:MAG: GMC family oxidoreductase [Betaproteobacteria bacterium RIFCSPLOWO2_12_FULL_62_13]